jgi:hypothetical protein
MSDAFEKWRYVYEHDELQINLGFMDKLAKATQSAAHNAVGAEQAGAADRDTASRARSKRIMTWRACCALESTSRGR